MHDPGLAPLVRVFLLRIVAPAADASLREVVDHLHVSALPAPVGPDAPPVHSASLSTPRHVREAMALLSPAESRRAQQLRAPLVRDAYACVHAALRLLLARELQSSAPPLFEFERSPLGKPFIAGQPHVHFSLSYRAGVAALALASAPVGVDVEPFADATDIQAIGARFFTLPEQAFLAAAPAGEARSRFFALWTRKEALLKALGAGVDAMPGADALKSQVTLANPDGVSASCCLHSLAAPADCALALAVRIPHSLAAATAAIDGPTES
jgi:4'-phosphopantetheinyl transferase